MKAKKKQPSMQIKKPSLKGMKNTKYLGHFAQDQYIQKGHNLSGIFDVYRQPSAIEMMAPSNPFDAAQERQRRLAQTDIAAGELAGIDPEAQYAQQNLSRAQAELSKAQQEHEKITQGAFKENFIERSGSEYRLGEARKREQAAQSRMGRASARSKAKKFIEEV